MREISCTFTFEAAHRLTKVPPKHKCARMHGHSFVCEVFVRAVPHQSADPDKSELDAQGMVTDFDTIREAWATSRCKDLDHNCLNEIRGLENPTSEVIASWIYGELIQALEDQREEIYVDRVVVRETCRSSASFP